MTLKEAIALAANDDVILCKAGEYEKVAGSGNNGEKSSFLVAKPLTIRGGLKGTDDVTLDDVSPVSTFAAPDKQISIFYVKTAAGVNVFENLKLTGVAANSRYYVFSAISKTGAGSIEVRNCQIVNNTCGNDNCAYGEGLNFARHCGLDGGHFKLPVRRKCQHELCEIPRTGVAPCYIQGGCTDRLCVRHQRRVLLARRKLSFGERSH